MKVRYDPNKHHRRSIRLKGYDYAQAGRYFVTFCVKDREHFFGKIIDDEMHLNEAGIMIEKWYLELENKFPKIQCHEYVVMPNHFHAIIQIVEMGRGEPMCSPEISDEPNNMNSPKMFDATTFPDTNSNHIEQGRHVGLPQQSPQKPTQSKPILGEHKDSPLWEVVQWFKTMSTNEYIRGVKTLDWERFNGKLWQRNYYEHIIRNDESCERIATYIINNPKNWNNDSLR